MHFHCSVKHLSVLLRRTIMFWRYGMWKFCVIRLLGAVIYANQSDTELNSTGHDRITLTCFLCKTPKKYLNQLYRHRGVSFALLASVYYSDSLVDDADSPLYSSKSSPTHWFSVARAKCSRNETRKGASEGERGKNTCRRRAKRRLLSRFLAQAS